MRKPFRVLALTVFLATLTCLSSWGADPLVFGVHPFKKPAELILMFKPLTDHLSKELGTEVQLLIGKNYEEVIQGYETDKIDFGFMGPSTFAMEAEKGSVKPLARIVVKGKGSFQGVIITKQDSPIKTVADLKGQAFAFGDPESTLSHYVPHYMLMQEGIYLKDLSKHAFVGNHDNVALNVLQGNFAAGGVKPETADQYLERGLKVLATSEPIPEHLFVASSRMDAEMFQRVKKALLQADLELIKPVNKGLTGLEEAGAEDYAGLRKIMVEVDSKDPARQ